jgi:hypothetical protein
MRHIFFAFFFVAARVFAVRSGAYARDRSTPVPQTLETAVTQQEATILKRFFDKLNDVARGAPDAATAPRVATS